MVLPAPGSATSISKPSPKIAAMMGHRFKWDEERRFLLRCELDAVYFHLYDIACNDVDYIMETFPIVKREDEKQYGEYRTKHAILEIYNETQITQLVVDERKSTSLSGGENSVA